MPAPPDERQDELVARVGRGESEAVEEVLDLLRPLVAAAVHRKMRPPARRWMDPEDLVQVVLTEIAGRIDKLPAEGGWQELRRWTWRTVDLRLRDAWRKHQRMLGESAITPEGAVAERGGVGEVTRHDERRWLEELVSQLPEQYSEVVRLCAFEGMTPEAAAHELGISRDAVYKRYEKARRALQRRWRSAADG